MYFFQLALKKLVKESYNYIFFDAIFLSYELPSRL